MVVLGSGMMGENLFPGQAGLALLANSIATGAGLFVLIQCLGPLSGAHMNPVVSLMECLAGRMSKANMSGYICVQIVGAYVGILVAHVMFAHEVFEISSVERAGGHLLISEVLATFGLISVVLLSGKSAAVSVAAYITSAYWFTSSTSFANPAVTLARCFTNSFGGMAPEHFLGFVCAQIIGALMAFWVLRKVR